jgi:formylglycine-generating enzyme required for sulfatase activity
VRRATLFVIFVGALIAGLLVVKQHRHAGATCDAGFAAWNARCIPENCPAPLAIQNGICDAPDSRIEIPETAFVLGPSDWEAEGRVSPRNVHVKKFSIDAFEATIGHMQHATNDAARAASEISRADADAFCKSRGGRLPTEDEWLAAAAGEKARRYPWGDTGAVCRRAAWGLSKGPCAQAADGPDSVGSHASGDTPNGIHDLAGNVAEWVTTNDAADASSGVVLGGSYETSLATELRTWERRVVNSAAREKTIGFRCAYDLP